MPLKARDLKPGDKLVRDNGACLWTFYNPPPPEVIEEIEFVEVHNNYVTVKFISSNSKTLNGNTIEPVERYDLDRLVHPINRRLDKQ